MTAKRLRRRAGEGGSQSLEWVALSSFIVTLLLTATQYARQNLGGSVGEMLVNHMKSFVQ
jgi:hypothetical protein